MLLTNRIAAERAHFGFTLKQLADRVHEPVDKVLALEETGNGEVAVLVKIAAFFRVSVDYLLGLAPYTALPVGVATQEATPEQTIQKKRVKPAQARAQDDAKPSKRAAKPTKADPWHKGYIGGLEIPPRAKKVLYEQGITSKAKFFAMPPENVSQMYGIGPHTATAILKILKNNDSKGQRESVE